MPLFVTWLSGGLPGAICCRHTCVVLLFIHTDIHLPYTCNEPDVTRITALMHDGAADLP